MMHTENSPGHVWRKLRLRLLTPLLVCLLAACSPLQPTHPTTSSEASLTTAWFDLARTLVTETPGFSPPVAARAYAYLALTLYETVRPGMPGALSLAGQLNDLDPLPQPQPLWSTAGVRWSMIYLRGLTQATAEGDWQLVSAPRMTTVFDKSLSPLL
jgi:hypothetical protein